MAFGLWNGKRSAFTVAEVAEKFLNWDNEVRKDVNQPSFFLLS